MPSAGGHIPERGAAAAAQAASRRCWGRGRGTDVATATPAALQAQGLRSCGGSCRKGQEQGRPACPALSGGPRRLPGRLRSAPPPEIRGPHGGDPASLAGVITLCQKCVILMSLLSPRSPESLCHRGVQNNKKKKNTHTHKQVFINQCDVAGTFMASSLTPAPRVRSRCCVGG